MRSDRLEFRLVLATFAALIMSACQDSAQSPPSRPEQPVERDPSGAGPLGPVDLVYICGDRFIATNSTRAVVAVTYRVAGTDETGSLTLPEALGDDEGFSEVDFQTKGRGVVELYQDGERVARRRNAGIPCGASAARGSLAGVASGEGGSWTPPFTWPNVAIHLSLLPTGKVLSWGEYKTPHLWDPVTEIFTSVPSPALLFCSGHSFLGDGRLLVAGGHIDTNFGLPDITIFDSRTESWSQSTPMLRGRWYPTVTTMADGDPVILAGRDQVSEMVLEPEVWRPGGSRILGGAARAISYYPRAFLTPNGELFHAGEHPGSRFLDASGSGRWRAGPSMLYGRRDYGTAVMYDDGKILYAGGARTTNTAEIIDLNSAAPAWQWTGSMAVPRRHLNATVLPTGEVLVTGGSNGPTFNDYLNAVHSAELWSPVTGTWRTLASNSVNRAYHSTSILLPDGRVLHAGGGDGGGQPGIESAEIFSPPYLFQGARPAITAAPSTVGYGTSFRVSTPQAGSIDKVSLIRLGSTTHAFNMNQRFQWLSFTREAGALTILAPTSRNRTPPGHYMLFILDDDVPSEARIVKIGSVSDPDPPSNAPPVSRFTAECVNLVCTFTDASTDPDGTVAKWKWNFGDGASSDSPDASHTYAAAGTFRVTLVVTDNDNATGTSSQDVTVSPAPAPPVANFTWSCEGLTCGFTDGSTDESAVSAWSWDFGDGGTSSVPNPSHTYASDGSYEVTLTATDDADMTGTITKTVTVTPPEPNEPPAARFTSACTNLACTFSDGSTDEDGTVVAWSWDFGDGGGAIARNPGHTYAVAGSYNVTLSASDDDGATDQSSATLTVTAPPPPTIALTVNGQADATKHYMKLRWTGATGATVNVYRNGSFLTNTLNDGIFGNSRTFQGPATYTYKVCQAGTSVCSNAATVQFGGGTPPSISLTVTGRTDATKQYMTLRWSGAIGATVDVYRNGPFLTNTVNDGVFTNNRTFKGAASYTYKVCLAASSTCTNEATVVF